MVYEERTAIPLLTAAVILIVIIRLVAYSNMSEKIDNLIEEKKEYREKFINELKSLQKQIESIPVTPMDIHCEPSIGDFQVTE